MRTCLPLQKIKGGQPRRLQAVPKRLESGLRCFLGPRLRGRTGWELILGQLFFQVPPRVSAKRLFLLQWPKARGITGHNPVPACGWPVWRPAPQAFKRHEMMRVNAARLSQSSRGRSKNPAPSSGPGLWARSRELKGPQWTPMETDITHKRDTSLVVCTCLVGSQKEFLWRRESGKVQCVVRDQPSAPSLPCLCLSSPSVF